METGLITPDYKFIPIQYYEIGAFAENICNQYIEESETNKIQFEMFASDYHFFKPHLDFLLFKLGYKMLNPLLKEYTMWYVENDNLYLKSQNQKKQYISVCDNDLGIQYINPEKIESCVADFSGRTYKVFRRLGIQHEEIFGLILNQYLIYDKELLEMYKDYADKGMNIGAFCRNMLGFYHIGMYPDQSGYIAYCSDFYNSYMDNVCKRIKEIYPKIEILPDHIHTKESLEIANKCIEKVGEINENRRLRF